MNVVNTVTNTRETRERKQTAQLNRTGLKTKVTCEFTENENMKTKQTINKGRKHQGYNKT